MNPKFPFGAASVSSTAGAASVDLEVSNLKHIEDFGELSAAMTLNVEADAELPAGAELHIKVKSDGTARDVTLGTGFTGTTISGTINKTKVASFVYDGSSFLHVGTQQVD